MSARRCSRCSTNWPLSPRYTNACPECQTATWLSTSSEPISEAEASSRANHAEFDRYLTARDARQEHEGISLLVSAFKGVV